MVVQSTSLEAYQYAQKTLSARQEQVYQVIKKYGPITNNEISQLLRLPINSITPRCLELRNKSLVTKSGTKIDVTGRPAITWQTSYPSELFN